MRRDLQELYQAVVLDHARSPRNFRRVEDATCHAHGSNPMCGDEVTVYLAVGEDGVIDDAGFEAKGCAISLASGSIMTEVLVGRTPAQAERLFEAFERLCTGADDGDLAPSNAASALTPDGAAALDRLRVLEGVRSFPVRIRCAILPWQAMHAALSGRGRTD
ncbi:MAG: SUF system NifU family Fe-S cluster assembly protein [Rhodospirillales bacterium]|nr:SUF system NifU family Fe-S cluster assembly protein [Rhodospirillales bacterium]